MKLLDLEIITPSKSLYKGKVKSVTVPGSLGNFQILYNHAPILSSLEIGKIKVVDESDAEIEFATAGGTVEVRANYILILADSAELKEEINLERAQSAYERAKNRLSERDPDVDLLRAEAAMRRALNRIKFFEK
jgi:F-type H+-transporting ATPase subunit epsilon